MNRTRAFTLAEVLVALALLGIVAAFAIPQVLQATEESRKKSVYRHYVGEISKIIGDLYLTQRWTGDSDELHQILQEKLNVISAEKLAVGADGYDNYRYTFEDGARLSMHTAGQGLGFSIDYNGTDPPNQFAQDQMGFAANLKPTTSCGLKPGGVGYWDPAICPQFTYSSRPTQEIYDYYVKMTLDQPS